VCQACDLLKGLEPAALVPDEVLRREPVHYVEGFGTAPAPALYPQHDSPLAGRIRRYTPPGSDIHGEDAAWRGWRDAVLARGLPGAAAVPRWTPSMAAVATFAAFEDAMAGADLAGNLRCLLAWPTPCTLLLAPGGPDLGVLDAEAIDGLLQSLESALAAELIFALGRLPADRLSLQWAASGELRVWETRARDIASRRSLPQRVLQGYERLARACVPALEVGFHYCRRDAWSVEAATVAALDQACRLVGATLSAFDRPLSYVHLNVPSRFTDQQAFDGLANLVHWPEIEVHLGLLRPGASAAASEDALELARLALPYAAPSAPCGVDPVQVLTLLEAMPRVTLGDGPEEAFS
jgi:hypothetical protein